MGKTVLGARTVAGIAGPALVIGRGVGAGKGPVGPVAPAVDTGPAAPVDPLGPVAPTCAVPAGPVGPPTSCVP